MNELRSSEIQNGGGLPWADPNLQCSYLFAKRSAQNVGSPEYKQLKKYIHMPYRKIDNQGVKCFYFPVYPVFKIKNITEFDFDALSARINGVLIIEMRVDYVDLFSPDSRKNDLHTGDTQAVRAALQQLFNFRFEKGNSELPNKKQNYLYIQFNRENPMRLPAKRIFEGQIKQDNTDGMEGFHIKWTIRKEFTISLEPGTFFDDLIAPFNLLNFKLSLSLEDVDIKIGDEDVKFKFNCMKRVGSDEEEERKRVFEQLMFTDDGTLGEYDLAETSLDVSCSKYRAAVNQEQLEDEVQAEYRAYKVVNFTIPFYKYPIMDALTIFIPLVLITILTLFTFAQGPQYNDKIGNIATLMIVYVGLVPVIADSLPPTTSITLIDIVVYFQLTINVLCLARGYTIRSFDDTQFDNYRLFDDPLFIISFVIAIISGIILVLLLVYYCIMKGWYYNLEEGDIDESERKTWHWVSPHMYTQARNLKTSMRDLMGDDRMQNLEKKMRKH